MDRFYNIYYMRYIFLSFLILLLFSLLSCSTVDLSLLEEEKKVFSQKGVDTLLIEEALLKIEESKIDSMIISLKDEVILERYNNGFIRDDKHDLRSATKSITSLLIGIAIDKGFIDTIDQSIMDYFPEYVSRGSHFSSISIGNLLTMTSGLDSDDWNPKSPGNEEKMYRKKSWIDFFFSLELKYESGEVFQYSTAGVVVLGEIIRRSSNIDYQEFAETYLFAPLGITDYSFETTRVGEADSGGHLRLKPLDFNKIGEIYLHKGYYKGTPIVSEYWINESLIPRIKIDRGFEDQYLYEGYLWWLEPVIDGKVKSFQARGNGGQYLIIIPEIELLCTFTGSAYNSNEQMYPFYLIQNYILPAIRKKE